MARTTRSFIVTQQAWNEIGIREHENRAFARSAYAYKQADLYARLASNSKALEEKAEKKKKIYQQWYDLTITLFELSLIFTQVSVLGLRYTRSRCVSYLYMKSGQMAAKKSRVRTQRHH